MSQSFDLQSLLWLIHSEISSAVYAVKSESAPIEMQQVRVRMGQTQNTEADDSNVVSLPTERYPAAEQGWVVDVVYDATQNQSKIKTLFESSKDSVPSQWQGVSDQTLVVHLEGVGLKRAQYLKSVGVETLAELLTFDFADVTRTQKSLFRRLTTLARLSLQLPPVAVPNSLLDETVMNLIEERDRLEITDLSIQGQELLTQWLLNLEICFDDAWLQKTTLYELVYGKKHR
ncbi:MAG: hypothetical protein JXK16_08245 [Thiotrichales bacterium]|nr:hypothetical protein [Thiotrichales bacterium]